MDDGHNQNPPEFPAELTTKNTLNHRANAVHNSTSSATLNEGSHDAIADTIFEQPLRDMDKTSNEKIVYELREQSTSSSSAPPGDEDPRKPNAFFKAAKSARASLAKYARFIGPGFMVSVAYIDPGTSSVGVHNIQAECTIIVVHHADL